MGRAGSLQGLEGQVVDDFDSPHARQDAAKATPANSGNVATARRRLMLGAAFVVPSVITLPSGAQTAAASNLKCWAKELSDDPPERFTRVPDGWLRKQVYVGKYHGQTAICTMWDQAGCVDERKERQGAEGTTWATTHERVVVGKGAGIEHVSDSPELLALVYVDRTATKFALEPDEEKTLRPVRETCWTSMIGDRGSTLG